MDKKKFVLISDVHGLWPAISYPEGDILIIAGDILDLHGFDRQSNIKDQYVEAETLVKFLDNFIKSKHYSDVVVVAGNHDFCFEAGDAAKLFEDKEHLHYLQDSEVVIDGIKFYGSPMTPWFGGWAFNFPAPDPGRGVYRARAHARKCWEAIPDDVDVLITHGPPYGILDETARGESVGCPHLLERLKDLSNLKLHVFGHIHASNGAKTIDGVKYINASQCFSHNKLQNKPWCVYI